MTDDLITRLRQLSRAEHDDLDICDEATEEIINLRVDVHVLREMLEKYKRDAIEAALQSQAIEAYPCRIVETDFEANTVTLEMQGKYTVSSGQKYLCDVPLYRCPDFSCQGLLDSSNHIASTGEGNVFSARDLCLETGYAKWDSFKNLVLRASQMISNGIAKGSIKETKKSVDIGSGAKRRILDYKLDDQAKELVCFLAGSFKLNGYYALRNETAILGLVKKWCDLRGIATHHQKEVGGFFVDLQVGESISIEFDEPHHAEQKKEDEIKTKALQAHGNKVLRFGIDCDVIDIIAELEKLTLASKMVVPEYAEVYVGDGLFAICDWQDWDSIKSYKWSLSTRGRSGCLYAQTKIANSDGTRSRLAMHHAILPQKEGFVVDHINGNGLDNRRDNLRYATIQQNSFNQKIRKASSIYKGVSFDKESGLWRATIGVNGKKVYGGRHETELEAAKAYDEMAKKYFGEFAVLNLASAASIGAAPKYTGDK